MVEATAGAWGEAGRRPAHRHRRRSRRPSGRRRERRRRTAIYHEYLHLVRTAGGWRIVNALWSSPDGAGPRADPRPLPRRRGRRRARRRAPPLRGLRRGRADGAAAADVVDHPLPPLEAADPLPGPPLPRGGVRRPRQRAVRSPRRPAAYADASSPPTRWRCWTPPHRRAVARRAFAGRAARARCSPPSTPSACRRRLHLPGGAARPDRPRRRPPRSRPSSTRRGLGEVQPPTTGCATTATSWSSSSARCSPNRTRPSRSRTASAGASTPTRSAGRRTTRPASTTRETSALGARVRCPVLVIHGDEDEIRPQAAAPPSPS